jgi:hypothetical protein
MSKTLLDEIIEFTIELTELIQQDWEKTKKFIKEHKKYFFWLITLAITMQMTDIMSLGESWNNYCKLNKIQNGGAEGQPKIQAAPTPEILKKLPSLEPEKQKETEENSKSSKENEGSDTSSKTPKKGMFGKAKSGLKNSIKNNPVLGNLGGIFDAVGGMFTLIMFILIVVGILSLPVVIFIVITYCIVKNLLSKLAIL